MTKSPLHTLLDDNLKDEYNIAELNSCKSLHIFIIKSKLHINAACFLFFRFSKSVYPWSNSLYMGRKFHFCHSFIADLFYPSCHTAVIYKEIIA